MEDFSQTVSMLPKSVSHKILAKHMPVMSVIKERFDEHEITPPVKQFLHSFESCSEDEDEDMEDALDYDELEEIAEGDFQTVY